MNDRGNLQRAAMAISQADAILVGAGAGMGVDSGLPDFRGDEGFWKAYPPFRKLGVSFHEMADPVWFFRDAPQAWGFYGHRRNLYSATTPHEGFRILQDICAHAPYGYFVFTSNVDGHFQKSGFPDQRLVECHGSLQHLQCNEPCCDEIWQSTDEVEVDETTFRAVDPLPQCARCHSVARPNVLMFSDGHWVSDRTHRQQDRYGRWLSELPTECRMVAIEMGAGTAVPTVRFEMERQTRGRFDTLIRINPRESHGANIGIDGGALESLAAIAELLR